jgi:hypothetical protein
MLYHKFKTGGTTIINELNDDEIITFAAAVEKKWM